MSKNKDIEKKLEKEIEKIKPEKEIEKIKADKPEKRELKEIKHEKLEIKERKEFKEPYKEKIEKIEQKEFKEIEKKIFEKGGKEIVEGGGGPIDVLRAEKPVEKEDEGFAAAPKQKELEKIKPEKEHPEKIQKDIDKIKPEKEFPDKIHKEIEKIKPEKEFEKIQKDIEKIKPEKEVFEKLKPEFEKGVVEGPEDPTTRTPVFKRAGSAEDRLGQLEDAVEKLSHFIGVDLRPDLSTGALKGEPDAGGAGSGEGKEDDKKKPK